VQELHMGAVMNQIVLADEINRTSPKTQSALLEIMQENQVTIDGSTYAAPRPFMVLATQNPVETAGTYPLPEAQAGPLLHAYRDGVSVAPGGNADPAGNTGRCVRRFR